MPLSLDVLAGLETGLILQRHGVRDECARGSDHMQVDCPAAGLVFAFTSLVREGGKECL